jgi:hypothetical protein
MGIAIIRSTCDHPWSLAQGSMVVSIIITGCRDALAWCMSKDARA